MISTTEGMDHTTTDTPHCTFTLLAPRLLEQRFKPSARFLPDVMLEVGRARDRLCAQETHALMVVIPAEIPVEPAATNVDHFAGERTKRRIHALALVAEDAQMHSVSKFYFSWYPQVFPVQVFDEERDALEWLKGQLAEIPADSRSSL